MHGVTDVLDGSARSHTHGVSEVRGETSLLGVNSFKSGMISRCRTTSEAQRANATYLTS
jgi:hypothetical protein